ncbi:MAG: amidophosphoribosyltransferase [Marivita sp. XM-24bin2]|nr:MAG: amidophosphoribosyltransferase [Marivita sp. XM-24bin2]
MTLLGTFGPQTAPQALLKLRGGKTSIVSRGDRVNGQTVVAIEKGRMALARNGTTHWLEMPAPNS